ncbi:hypothetical protein Tco_1563762 [Tanacetum coccineum]
MSSKGAEKESTNSGSNDDDKTHMTGSMVESSTTKKLMKFDFITEDGKHIHLTEEQINQQKKIEEEAKAEVAKHEGEYDRYCDKMLNRRAESRITNCDVLTMQYTIQEIFRRHQGLGLDDHARTFSSLLLVEVDKRNLNPLRQMRVIEQLRQ